MNLRFINWIWRVRGTMPLEPKQTAAEAFEKIDDLFQTDNTIYEVEGDTLTFKKWKQRPQDKMSVFDSGTIRVSDGVLRYDMLSKALIACFLAPLFFFAIGHIGIAMDNWRNPPEVVKAKEEAAKKRQSVKPEDVPMNPIDAFLGAPKPEKKKDEESKDAKASKDGKDAKESKGDEEEIGKRKRKPSMTRAYVFMGIFFGLWLFGRILENKLIHNRLRSRIRGTEQAASTQSPKSSQPIIGNQPLTE